MSDHELVMPFITVASKGGPHEDEAYAAGYAMGLLDARLGAGGPVEWEAVRETCIGQADLLALRHGYTTHAEPSQVDGWCTVAFARMEQLR